MNKPLAELLRPTHWNEVIGQTHLLGKEKPLRLVFESGKPHSMIFWGPPGVGKTTLARLTALAFDCEWIAISAVLAGVKDIRDAVEAAKKNLQKNRQTILFIDEIHRFNKAQQDALLPFTESGLLTLIGATTENPSFEVISPLLSRLQVYVLTPLADDELFELFQRTCKTVLTHLQFEKEAVDYIIADAGGDARHMLNLLQLIASNVSQQKISILSLDILKNMVPIIRFRRFDKKGDNFYDQISALHKSVRGSHPDAALYWFTRMLDGGADPLYLARRIIRMAWEDIGLADPTAIQLANNAALTYERLGSPEGELALAEAVIYLSVAAKSNAGYSAFQQAQQFVKTDSSRSVPAHLCNAPTTLLKKIGKGKGYRYAHNEPYGYAAKEQYLPDSMPEPNWYQPVDRGLETKIAARLKFLKTLDDKK